MNDYYKFGKWTGLFLLVILLQWLPTTIITAQTNAFKIDDHLYSYYVKLNKYIRSDVSLAMADTLFNMSAVRNDKKAQCLALTMKNMHYYYEGNLPRLIETMKVTQNFALKTPYKQYYFDPWNRLINYYLKKNQITKALEETNAYQKEALRLNNGYGISQSYRKLADIYTIMGDTRLALGEFKNAIRVRKEMNDLRDINDLYYGIGGCYNSLGDYQRSKMYFQMAYEGYTKNKFKASCVGLFRAYVDEGIHSDSIEYFKKICDREYAENQLLSSNKEYYLECLVKYYIIKKDYQKALEYANLAMDNAPAVLKRDVYLAMGDYKNAYKNMVEYLDLETASRDRANQALMVELVAKTNQSILEKEKQQLELNNTQMKLQQSLSHEKIMHMLQLQNKLELDNRQLALEKQKAIIDRNTSEISKAKAKNKFEESLLMRQKDREHFLEKENTVKKHLLLISFLFLIAVVSFSIIYIYIRYKQNEQLKKEKDLAERAQAYADEQRKKAERADSLKSLFLQNMSHEIRTPLNAIVGFNDVLNGDSDVIISGEERKQFVGLIRSNSDLLITLVNDILDLSKLESGTYQMSVTHFCAQDVCEIVMASLKSKVNEGVVTHLDLAKDKIWIDSDQQRIQQLLSNLVSNACKYTERGSITMACHIVELNESDKGRKEKVLEFSVTDTGSGIPLEMSEIIFERFEKLNSFKQGTGLGLHICKHIAELLNGKIYVDNTYRDGARFVFRLPLPI